MTLLAAVVASAPSALGAVLVSQPAFSAHVDPLNFGQSFTAPTAANVTGIRLRLVGSSGGSEITLRLYDFDRTTLTLGAAVLGVGTLPEASVPAGAPAWVEVPMNSPSALVAGNTYAFTVQATDPGGVSGWNNYATSFSDVYAGGEYFGGLTGVVSTNTNLKELAFEIMVPEPTSIVLLAVGSVGLLIIVRRHGRR